MKTAKQRREKSISLSSNGIRKRTSSRLQLKKQRVSETGQELNEQNQDEAVSFTKEKKNITMRKLECVKPLIPSPKIKLQLFPRDADTRMGLEKDGHNPYLELTLRPRKKINSVIKHLDSKWGTSSIALGELMLLPCNTGMQYPASCQRWTLNDSGVSAGDVYIALGSPAIFRLRYGWFSAFDIGSFEVPHLPTGLEGFSLHKSTGKNEKRQSPVASEESKQKDDDIGSEFDIGSFEVLHLPTGLEGFSLHKSTGKNEKRQSPVASEESGQKDDNMSLNPQAMDDEVRVNCSIPLKSTPQTDSSLDISIGGLFSDASLQDMLKTCDAKSTPTTSALQPDQLVSESLDAFIASKMNPQFHLRGQMASSRTQSSILDAEETCHAFAFQNISSGKDKYTYGSEDHNPNSKPLKDPNLTEVNSQSNLAQGKACSESKTDMLPCSHVINDESSLGLTGIKWNDSLGPFDVGVSSLLRMINEESLSCSKWKTNQNLCFLESAPDSRLGSSIYLIIAAL